jgi:hypothetical protein
MPINPATGGMQEKQQELATRTLSNSSRDNRNTKNANSRRETRNSKDAIN